MIVLVDCNSFFCSVEKVFHSGLRGKPVCVLSNNDGCIVALTPEAKKIGLHRGEEDKVVERLSVSVGIAPTTMLAKMGSKFAKKYKGYDGVCLIDTDEKRRKFFSCSVERTCGHSQTLQT